MFLMRIIAAVLQIGMGILPGVFSAVAVGRQNWMGIPLALLAVYVLVAVLPLFRKHEFVWILLFTLPVVFPVDLWAVDRFASWMGPAKWAITDLLREVSVFLTLMSIEELLAGYLARLFWKKQYKLKMLEEDD